MENFIKITRIITPFAFSGLISYLAVLVKNESLTGVFCGFAVVSVLAGCYAVIKSDE